LGEWARMGRDGVTCVQCVTQALVGVGAWESGFETLARAYGGKSVARIVWTNMTGEGGWIEFRVVELPSAWHAYGVYESIGEGRDESVVRGGPSKRVGRGLLVLKGRWVVWDEEGGAGIGVGAREWLRERLYERMPGRWELPEEVRRLWKMEPRARRVEFRMRDGSGCVVLDGALVASFDGGGKRVEFFVKRVRGGGGSLRYYEAVRRWLEGNELIGVHIEREGERELFVPEERGGYLYVRERGEEWCGVRGLEKVGEARALVEQWAELAEQGE
ncbi:MAG: hypothetical protein N2595_07355, partial [bacterium]|nr:hypothetical protein [bacterium]